MKKFIFSAVLLCSSSIGFAQLLDIMSTQKVNPEGTQAYTSTLSPTGEYLLLSSLKQEGLQKLDLQTGKVMTLTTAKGSGYDAKISNDGKSIVFRENTVDKNRLKKTKLNSIDLQTGKQRQLTKFTRNLEGVSFCKNTLAITENGKTKFEKFASTTEEKSLPNVYIRLGQLMISQNGKTKVLSPNGTEGQSYLWPSVSPDGTKVVYYLAASGAYTCNIDGSNVKFLGNLRAPKWYNDQIVVGMNDADNGEYVTSSSIIAVSADGATKQTISNQDLIAMYPSASAASGKISFTTPTGDVYIINVKTK